MTDTALHTLPLSPFLRMAVVAGVENAIQIHIDRGDDLNARDANGQTPLMLSAARNKASICKLLLSAGADADLRDTSGYNAFDIALAAGASEAARAIKAACALPPAVPTEHAHASEHARNSSSAVSTLAFNRSSAFDLEEAIITPFSEPLAALEPEPVTAQTIELDANDIYGLDLAGWEAEEDQPPPEGDLTLSAAAVEVQSAITEYQPIDNSADWDDIEAFLPNLATPLPRADNMEARERLRLVLLRAIREGSVPQWDVNSLALGDDGKPDLEACALLGMVINDLGAETDERFEYSALHENFEVFVSPEETLEEMEVVVAALTYVDNLSDRRNDPLRIYQREFQSQSLLTAEAEVALGKAMERWLEMALDALADWPSGVGLVLKAAQMVVAGTKPLPWMSSGPQVEPEEIESPESVELTLPVESEVVSAEGGAGSQFGLDAKESSEKLADFCVNAKLLSGHAVGVSRDAPEWDACRAALASLGLTRGFLMELADAGLAGEPDPALAFSEAMRSFRGARDQMVVANLKLVFSIAKKYLFSGQPLDDLLQEGNIGLLKAVDRYDWRRGFKFSTYATWWIRQQVGRFVADKSKTIRLPVHVYEKTQRIAQASHAFELRHSHAPTVDEIAALVELPVHRVMALSRATVEPLPLHELEDLDGLIAADAKDQFTARDPMEIVEDMQLIGLIDRVLGTLKLKEANVLRMRFGIGIQESMTLEEVGARLEVTRERIRQIEAKAIRRLKHPARLASLLRELGTAAAPQQEDSAETYSEAPSALTVDVSSMPRPATLATPKPEPWNDSEPTALDKLLAHARDWTLRRILSR